MFLPRLLLLVGRSDEIDSSHDDRLPDRTRVIVLASVVAGCFLVTAAFVVFMTLRLRRRQWREAKRQNPYITRSEYARRVNMTSSEREQYEELERKSIIQKSVASKSSILSSSSSRASSYCSTITITTSGPTDDQVDNNDTPRTTTTRSSRSSSSATSASEYDFDEEEDRDERTGLRADWKQWEAQQEMELYTAGAMHPSLKHLPPPPPRVKSASPSRSQSPMMYEHEVVEASARMTSIPNFTWV